MRLKGIGMIYTFFLWPRNGLHLTLSDACVVHKQRIYRIVGQEGQTNAWNNGYQLLMNSANRYLSNLCITVVC